jgi:SAM-dependent methyltransferase
LETPPNFFARIAKRFFHASTPQSRSQDVSISNRANYEYKLEAELATFKNQVEIHELPPIFHYWSGKYLSPMLQAMNFAHPDDFFFKKLGLAWDDTAATPKRFLSIGAGNCDTEIRVAQMLVNSGRTNFTIECLEINTDMLERGHARATTTSLSDQLAFACSDFNTWQATHAYDGVMANQSLHHVVELEHLFDAVRDALAPNARFVVADMIGRNGHQLWPEATAIVNEYWHELPEHYRYNHQLQRHEPTFLDWDSSAVGFEGIRAQDILRLLIDQFEFETFLPFANVVSPFIGRGFGHNFDVDSDWDRAFVDRVHLRDEEEMLAGTIKPTQMFAVLRNEAVSNVECRDGLTPERCVRSV